MITAGDIITTNYCGWWPQTWRVIEVRRDCQCGRWSHWPLSSHSGRQRLPHLHIVALDERGERNWWNGVIERGGRLIESSRMWVRPRGSEAYQNIHPEIRIVEKAAQGNLF